MTPDAHDSDAHDPDRPTPDPLPIALLGFGRMGREVARIARERGHRIVLVVGGSADGGDAWAVDAGATAADDGSAPPESDRSPEGAEGRAVSPVHLHRMSDAAALTDSGARVAIDFSVAEAVPDHARLCAEAGVDLAIGTTGWDARRDDVHRTARGSGIGLLEAPNFSLGVNLFFRIVAEAARLMDGPGREGDFDAGLFEAHHRHKVDHPSGTARRLAEIVVERMARKSDWSDRLPDSGAMDPSVLQVAVQRAGEIPGVHAVSFESADDRIELRHEARGRSGFARGAVLGAEWIRGRSGVFSMEDVLDDVADSTS